MKPSVRRTEKRTGNRRPGIPGPRRFRIIAAAAALAAVLAAGYLLLRPRPVFLVEDAFVPAWEKLLQEGPGAPGWRIVKYDPRDGLPSTRGLRGYRIATDREGRPPAGRSAAAGSAESVPIPVPRRDLSRNPALPDGALPLAVDPWMVFRRHTSPPPSRVLLAQGGSGAVILLPGGEPEALWAWVAQDLQNVPGSFPSDPGLWLDRTDRLARDGRFQPGALTARWEDVLSRLLEPGASWLYAPLSRVLTLPGDRTSLLEADPFPPRDGWNEFGLQARILWAVPLGGGTARGFMASAARWLGDPDIQTRLGAILDWAPAHRDARAANPLARTSQEAWLKSTYVWEAPEYAHID